MGTPLWKPGICESEVQQLVHAEGEMVLDSAQAPACTAEMLKPAFSATAHSLALFPSSTSCADWN